jgi:hypothetical protein
MSTGRTNQAKGEAERRAVADWYRKAGLIVLNLSQPGLPRGKHGRRGTFTSAGIPDLLVIHPVRGYGAWFHEVKSGRAKLSADQHRVCDQLTAAQMRVVVGGVAAAKAQLRWWGLLVSTDAGDVLRPVTVTCTDAPALCAHTTEVAG